jgi:hypothetical protein
MHFFSWVYSVGQLGLQCDSNSQEKVFHKPAATVPRRRASQKVRLLSSSHLGHAKNYCYFLGVPRINLTKKYTFLTDIFIAAVNTLHIKSSFLHGQIYYRLSIYPTSHTNAVYVYRGVEKRGHGP